MGEKNEEKRTSITKRSAALKMIGYSFATALGTSLIVLFVTVCVFGFELNEQQGRIVGLIGTMAGVAGAVVGLSIARRAKLPTVFGATIVPLLITSNSFAGSQGVMPSMVGRWEGSARIIVTWCRQTNLPVMLEIGPNATVTGKIGDATLTKGQFRQNRGWFARKLNLKTDYIITGSLTGPTVAAENIVRSSVKMPLNFGGGRFVGGIHTSGSKFGGKERMILSATFLTLARPPT